jgi:hypothetical protein
VRAHRAATVLFATAALVGVATVGAWASPMTVSSGRLAAVSLPVTITSDSFTADADAYTQQASPTTNASTGTTMDVASAVSANKRSFVHFDLTTIPTDARVQSATLQLRMSAAPAASRTYEVDKTNATWDGSTITWSNMPTTAAATATVASGTSSGVNLTWDVTTDVALFVAGSVTNNGWQVKDSAESSTTATTASFRTSEFSSAGQRPTLSVVYVT